MLTILIIVRLVKYIEKRVNCTVIVSLNQFDNNYKIQKNNDWSIDIIICFF